jgi:aspartyl protease family protein
MTIRLRLLLLALAVSLVPYAAAAQKVQLFALFKDKAIILIDGSRRVLVRGQTSPEGLKLLATDTQRELAEVELNGRRETLRLGVVSSAGFAEAKDSGHVMLYADRSGFFYSEGKINDTAVRFLIDTGANTIALNSRIADRIGLDYKRKGRRGVASTAGGVVPMYSIRLASVTVGSITLHDVEAGIIEGDHPVDVLLGMSFLGRLDMRRDGDKMELTKRY